MLAVSGLAAACLLLANYAPIKLRRLAFPGVMLGCIYGLIALGYSLIYKTSGLMSFVQGDIMTMGAFLGLTFFTFFRSLFGTGEEGKSNVGTFILSVALTTAAAFMFGLDADANHLDEKNREHRRDGEGNAASYDLRPVLNDV